MNRNIFHIEKLFPLAAVLMAASSCVEEQEWGIAKVYMPQAVIYNGGVTNLYPVPLDNNPTTNNYSIDPEGNLLVTLGVYRSGLQALESFSVTVSADIQASEEYAAAAGGRRIIPEGYWSLPHEVTVPAGSREAIFDLKIDLQGLQADMPELYDQRIVLVAGISEPTRYSLNESLSSVTIAVNCIRFFDVPPPPELVPGGKFDTGDEAHWNYANAGDAPPGQYFTIANGKMTISAVDGPYSQILGEYWVELNETLVPGTVYELTMDVTADGNGSSAEFNLGLAPEHSTDGYRYPIKNGVENGGSPAYKDYFFASIDAWSSNGLLRSPFSGVFPKDANYTFGFTSGSSTFTAGENQKYLCLQACTWGGRFGTITVDNISLREKR